MRSTIGLTLVAVLTVVVPAAAQTVVSSTLAGTVLASDGRVLPDAVVTVRSLELDMTREAITDLQGAYTVPFLTPGRYEVRVEAFGYRPVVYPLVRVHAGGTHTLTVSLTKAPPPVTRVDTVSAGAISVARWRGPGPSISPEDLDAERSLLGGWTSLARFSSLLGPALGSQGLPGVMTAQVVDGVPFFPARHPYLRGESTGSPAFPASLLARASVLADPGDVYWLGAAGTTLAADTRTGSADNPAGAEGAWSGGPLWSTGKLGISTRPGLTSYRAAMHAGFALVPDTSRLFVAGEAVRQQSPLQPRISQAVAGSLTGVDPALVSELRSPAIETVSRISGLARLDRWTGSTRFTLRAAAGHATTKYDGDGPGRLAYGAALPDDATDLSAAATLLSHNADHGFDVEMLGGLSLSDRTYGDTSGLPATTLVGPGVPLGTAAGAAAKVSRIDIFLSPAFHLPLSSGSVEVGLAAEATSHTIDQTLGGQGDVFFSDGAGLLNGSGAYMRGSSAKSSFSTSRLGIFAEDVWDAAPGLRITLGGRVDWEKVPRSNVSLDTNWQKVSGLRNDRFPTAFVQPAGVLAATWDVRGDGRTILFAAGSVSNGTLDPGLLHDAISEDGAASVRRYVGSGISWPDVGNGPPGTQSATVLTLLGPGTRAPRTAELGGGVVEDIGSGWSLHASASFRRTDFLPLRRDVNLPLYPVATDTHGRDVFGDVVKIGSVVAAVPGSNRRFAGFDAVWAVDPDGWSKYQGVSIGLEHATARSDAFVSYTRSRTTDNWIGAATGLPAAMLDPHLPGKVGSNWAEGTSDFDVPNRLVAGGRLRLDVLRGAELSATYMYESGLPFTPGYRAGVDANGDGSALNDVAWVPDRSTLGGLADTWPCLASQAGGFAARNSCRGPSRSMLNAGARVGLLTLGGRTVWVTVEGFDLLEDQSGPIDSALLLVDPSSPIDRSGNGVVGLPTKVNPSFGKVLVPSAGRVVRIGIRIGG